MSAFQFAIASYATLLDAGRYLCSVRTMYRILEEHAELRERRDQLRHPNYEKPVLLATGPNQVWSWDITKLLGPMKWVYFHLYVILDIFSRYVVGWMLAERESAELAKRLIKETCSKQGIVAEQLTLHADRGTSMKSKPLAMLLSDLGVTKTHSRPQVSNDNPYSESQFKTLKYRPEFPKRFGSIQHARDVCRDLFGWYNTEHYHSGIGLLTPESVHYGRAAMIVEGRRQVLLDFFGAHPERFVNGAPKPPEIPSAAWINPPTTKTTHQIGAQARVRGLGRPPGTPHLDLAQAGPNLSRPQTNRSGVRSARLCKEKSRSRNVVCVEIFAYSRPEMFDNVFQK